LRRGPYFGDWQAMGSDPRERLDGTVRSHVLLAARLDHTESVEEPLEVCRVIASHWQT
jgi:hypothetical protein